MKKLAYILFIFTQLTVAQISFNQGNALYSKGNFEEAAKAYESIIQNGEESAEVYFNLGNTYYQLKKVGPAIYNYEKALQLDPGNDDILINLGFAQKLAVDDIKAIPKANFSAIVYNGAGNFHYNSWAWAGVAFSFISALLFALYYFSVKPGYKQGFFAGMIVSILLMAVCICCAFFVRSVTLSQRTAIVFARAVTVKESPDGNATGTTLIHEGTKLTIVKGKDQKVQIELADGTGGWINKSAIKEL